MAIQDGGITVLDLSGVIHDNNLGLKFRNFSCWVVLGISANETSSDIFDGNVFNVESDIVTRLSFLDGFMMHFDRLNFSLHGRRGKSDSHTGFQ